MLKGQGVPEEVVAARGTSRRAGHVEQRRGCMRRIERGRAMWNQVGGPAKRAGRVPGAPGRSWGAVQVHGASSACGTCWGALAHVWDGSRACPRGAGRILAGQSLCDEVWVARGHLVCGACVWHTGCMARMRGACCGGRDGRVARRKGGSCVGGQPRRGGLQRKAASSL